MSLKDVQDQILVFTLKGTTPDQTLLPVEHLSSFPPTHAWARLMRLQAF